MAYGKGDVSGGGMNQHKRMAGADKGGDFGVGGYPGRVAKHPDVGMSHEAMDDGERMPAVAGKGRMMQGAPDHGDMGKDHFARD